MSALALPAAAREERRTWSTALVMAVAGHLLAATVLVAWSRPALPPRPEPVMLVELPAGEAPPAAAPALSAPQAAAAPTPAQAVPQPVARPLAQPTLQPVAAPAQRAPLPAAPVPQPVAPLSSPDRPAAPAPAGPAAASPQAVPAPAPATAPAPAGAGSDPRVRAAEVDYFSLLSAYLNRRKTYPVEARRARAEGVVVVRFTVDRDGTVSGTAIKRSSGHDLLDQATLALLQRVAPLPRMPGTMQRQSVTLALPIEYSLKTS